MPDNGTVKRDAILYIPGLTAGQHEVTVEGVSRRLAVALDLGAQSADARFSVSEGEKINYGQGQFEAERITVHRTDAQGSRPVFDVYGLDFRHTLKARFQDRRPARQAWSMLWLFLGLVPRFIAALPRKSKSLAEKMQLAIAGSVLFIIAAYLVLLIFTAAATVLDVGQSVVSSGTDPTSGVPVPANRSPGAESSENVIGQLWDRTSSTLAGYGWFQFLQSMIVVIAGIGLFQKESLKQKITELGIENASVTTYLSGAKASITGQFTSLLSAISEVEAPGDPPEPLYANVHVVAYSFGSIVAIDSLFKEGEAQTSPRFGLIRNLVTVGSPFDLVRAFWPYYFEDRRKPSQAAGLPWLNFYSPNDVLSSNYRDDQEDKAPSTDLDSLTPTNVLYPPTGVGQRLNIWERVIKARQLHQAYWGSSPVASNFWEPLTEKLFKGTPAMS